MEGIPFPRVDFTFYANLGAVSSFSGTVRQKDILLLRWLALPAWLAYLCTFSRALLGPLPNQPKPSQLSRK